MVQSEAVPLPIVGTVLGFVALSMTTDMRTRRIPNLMSGSAALAGLALNATYFGAAGVLASVVGAGATMSPLLLPFALGGIGGGDVKMMGAIGALLGVRLGINALAIGVVLGGVLMVVHLARCGRLREKMQALAGMLSLAAVGGSLEPLKLSASSPRAVSLPYSVPLGLGTLAVLACAGVR
jgi:prepilin peptidase CpaA